MARIYRPRVPPPATVLEFAARDVIDTLHHADVCGPDAVVYLIGSFACKVYCDNVPPYSAGYRSPNDVDIVTCTSLAQEDVKRRLAAHNDRIHLISSRTPGMTYKVVRYSPPGSDRDFPGSGEVNGKLIKVDTLIAEENLRIPAIPAERVRYICGWPLPPLSLLLLLRLQGWSDHRHALLEHHRHKALVDVSDLAAHLVPLALRTRFEGGATLWEEAGRYLPEEFLKLSLARSVAFVREYPWARADWLRLGIPVGRTDSRRPDARVLMRNRKEYDSPSSEEGTYASASE